MDIGNIHKIFGKDHTWGSRNILLEDRHTDRCSSQYFATAPAGKVIIFDPKSKF